MGLHARLKALERQRKESQEPLRVVIRSVCGSANLANSTCRRTLDANGLLTEIVQLDGSLDDLGEEGLERFIASFPIEAANP